MPFASDGQRIRSQWYVGQHGMVVMNEMLRNSRIRVKENEHAADLSIGANQKGRRRKQGHAPVHNDGGGF